MSQGREESQDRIELNRDLIGQESSSSSRTSNWEDSASVCRVVYPNPGYRQGPAQAKVERITSKRESSCPMMNCAG